MQQSYKDFTSESSVWLNLFVKDMGENKQALLKSVEKFPGDKALVTDAINRGPIALRNKNPQDCKEMFNFIEFHATGRITPISVVKVVQ